MLNQVNTNALKKQKLDSTWNKIKQNKQQLDFELNKCKPNSM